VAPPELLHLRVGSFANTRNSSLVWPNGTKVTQIPLGAVSSSQSNAWVITEAQLTAPSERGSVTVSIRSGSGHPESGNRARRRHGALSGDAARCAERKFRN
jgi:hypothetical protein